MRPRSALLIVPALVLLAGCTPAPASTPSPSATSPVTETPSPVPSPTEATAPPTSADFTKTELVALCKEQILALAPNATYFDDVANTEWLEASSLWFVILPKTLDGVDSVGLCGIGGTPAAPDIVLHGETMPDGVAEIRDDLLNGTHDDAKD